MECCCVVVSCDTGRQVVTELVRHLGMFVYTVRSDTTSSLLKAQRERQPFCHTRPKLHLIHRCKQNRYEEEPYGSTAKAACLERCCHRLGMLRLHKNNCNDNAATVSTTQEWYLRNVLSARFASTQQTPVVATIIVHSTHPNKYTSRSGQTTTTITTATILAEQ